MTAPISFRAMWKAALPKLLALGLASSLGVEVCNFCYEEGETDGNVMNGDRRAGAG